MEIDPEGLTLSTPAEVPAADAHHVTRPVTRPVTPPVTSRHAVLAVPVHRVWLAPTRVARLLATIGWVSAAATNAVLLFALEPDFELGEAHGYTVPLTDHAVFSGALVVSGLITSLSWLWWTTSAAFNARRLTLLGTSPLLPFVVYLGSPTLLVVGLDVPDYEQVCQWAAFGLLAIGHLVVLVSLRGTASRIGARTRDLTQLIILPIAWSGWRVSTNVVVSSLSSSWRTEWLLLGLGSISCLLLVGMAVSTWNATKDFDDACDRFRPDSPELHMPDPAVVAKAIRERYGQG